MIDLGSLGGHRRAGRSREGVPASVRTPHAASKALAAITRAGLALGYTRLVSCTLLGEAGTTYRAAGWHPVHAGKGERDWVRTDSDRAAASQPGIKIRWETGPDALPEDPKVAALLLASVGTVQFHERTERRMPLFMGRAS